MNDGPCSKDKYSNNCHCAQCLAWDNTAYPDKIAQGWTMDPSGGLITPPAGHRLYSQYFPNLPVTQPYSPTGMFGAIPVFPGWITPPDIIPATQKSPTGKLPPMNCLKCNYRNEYVGPEHLDELGLYTCRTCKGGK